MSAADPNSVTISTLTTLLSKSTSSALCKDFDSFSVKLNLFTEKTSKLE